MVVREVVGGVRCAQCGRSWSRLLDVVVMVDAIFEWRLVGVKLG